MSVKVMTVLEELVVGVHVAVLYAELELVRYLHNCSVEGLIL